MSRQMGWNKDKFDKKDYLHSPLKTPLTIPDVVNLNQYLPDVRDQGVVGSCVGFGIGINLSALAKRLNIFTEWFSPTWIYNGARFIEGSLLTDVGCYPRDACEWLRTKGGLLEHFWPYNRMAFDSTPPPSSFDPEAAKWPLLAYYRVTGGVDAICDALAAGYLVSIGTPWFQKWMNPGPDGRLEELVATDTRAGGHETCLYGYDKTINCFMGVNSWGTGWGNSGHYLMPFSSFTIFGSKGGYDAHYLQVNWGSGPGPVPEPEKTVLIELDMSYDGGNHWEAFQDDKQGRFSRLWKALTKPQKQIRLMRSEDEGETWEWIDCGRV
jgi:hypothetical protein